MPAARVFHICFIVAISTVFLIANRANAALPPGQCDITYNGADSPSCPSGPYWAVTPVPILALGITSTFQAVRSDAGMPQEPVDAWSQCYYVTNGATNSIFVPFNSPNEWASFVDNAPEFVSLNSCARPWQPPTPPADLTVSSATYCGSPQLISSPSMLPYAQTSSSPYPVEAQYTCDCQGTPWTETAQQMYVPGNANIDPVNGGWKPKGSVYYSGDVPKNCGTPNSGTWKFEDITDWWCSYPQYFKPTENPCKGTCSPIGSSCSWEVSCSTQKNYDCEQ